MPAFDDLGFTEIHVETVLAAQIPGQSPMDPAAISKNIGAGFCQLQGFLTSHKLTPAGPPRTIYTSYGKEEIKFILAVPVLAAPEPTSDGDGPISVGTLQGCKAMRFTHKGPYPNLMMTYGRITEFMKEKGLLGSEADWAKYIPMWEEYLNDPRSTPEENLLTHIYLPLP